MLPVQWERESSMTASPQSAERFHALDALRAAMMFLGIYLHAVVAYSPNGGWPWKQAEQTRVLDWSISIIHVFRMPIFYALRGFASGYVFNFAGPMHLWFLEYLILLYLVAVIAMALVRLLLSPPVRQM